VKIKLKSGTRSCANNSSLNLESEPFLIHTYSLSVSSCNIRYMLVLRNSRKNSEKDTASSVAIAAPVCEF